ncbi:hypothetical protein [Bacteroides gallinarum]|uniref:hypothetical protein n=1 Tax=Bacteroides gallinarum TaxID=376806 RepID=UPI000370B298|nr:hypothetical protein [Bacteroides gallinarum]
MPKKRIPIDKERFETLKNELIKVSGIDLSSDNAYSDLSEYIRKQSEKNFPSRKFEDGKAIQQSETISVDTLRRYWGDKDSEKRMTPDIGKLSFMARALGYKDWETFCHGYKQTNTDFDVEKGFSGMDYFKFSSLYKGEIVCIGWYPRKYCRLKFLGEYSFEVIESCGMRSEVGRRIETSGFSLAPASDETFPEVIIEPLYEYQEELWDAIENFNKETCPHELFL